MGTWLGASLSRALPCLAQSVSHIHVLCCRGSFQVQWACWIREAWALQWIKFEVPSRAFPCPEGSVCLSLQRHCLLGTAAQDMARTSSCWDVGRECTHAPKWLHLNHKASSFPLRTAPGHFGSNMQDHKEREKVKLFFVCICINIRKYFNIWDNLFLYDGKGETWSQLEACLCLNIYHSMYKQQETANSRPFICRISVFSTLILTLTLWDHYL